MSDLLKKKNCLIFGLEDVLIPGNIDSEVDAVAVKSILSNLQEYSKKHSDFRYFLVTGYSESIALEKIRSFNLSSYFPKDCVYLISKDYLASKEELDREIYVKKIQENPLFKDEFFKQYAIQKIQEKHHFSEEEIILIGNDAWFEGFYTRRYSKVDVAFIRSAYSELNQKQTKLLDGLIYIDRSWLEVQKLISGLLPAPSYKRLDDYISKKLTAMLFEGTGMPMVVNLNKKD